MLSAMLAVTEGIVCDIDEVESDPGTTEASSVSGVSQADEDRLLEVLGSDDEWQEAGLTPFPKYHVDKETLLQKCGSVSECLRLSKHLLNTASYIFGKTSAQVVPILLVRDTSADGLGLDEMVHFERLLILLVHSIWKDAVSGGEETELQLLPHKRKVLGGVLVRDCWANRDALVVSPASDISKWMSYSYIGGGLEWDPPHAFGLVNKSCPLHIADRLLALILFLSDGTVLRDFFTVKSCARPSADKPSPEEEQLAILERELQVARHLRYLTDHFASAGHVFNLLLGEGSEPPAEVDTGEEAAPPADLDPGEEAEPPANFDPWSLIDFDGGLFDFDALSAVERRA